MKPLSTDQLNNIQIQLHTQDLNLLIIDEISNVDPTTLAVINSRLKQIKNNDRDFGGINVLVVGDLKKVVVLLGETSSKILC